MFDKLFCKHLWKEVTKEILPSAYDQFGASGFKGSAFDVKELFKRKLVVIMICEKCGKIKKFAETNP